MSLIRYTKISDIVGDIVRVRARGVRNGELAQLTSPAGEQSLARVIEIAGDQVSLQVFAGSGGLTTDSSVRFVGRSMRVSCSKNVLGRTFAGDGEPRDGGPSLWLEPTVELDGPTVNPVRRVLPGHMIRTDVPMIDVFNSLVESQKIPIFTVPGEPYNELLARIGARANADVIVFGGLGLIFDDFHFFRTFFEAQGVRGRTVMFVNQASDPIVERLLVPDMALAVAEQFAVMEGKRVLVLMTDMTAYADALKEVGVAMERIPSNRGYMGDLYSQLARRYEKACDFDGAGSVTIVTVTTLPGDDVTHPVPDNTGYITEGQFYLHDRMIDPFGSLSRLKQRVIGKSTRDDHGQVMNAMIRLYSGAREAEQKQAMAFELSDYDERLVEFGRAFRERFMDVKVSMPLEQALDACWHTMAEFFTQDELLIKDELVDKYFPRS
ncbi:MAG: V-type ATP synthase subunit B [Myxococcales bacterium]|jgi:V/A-type H+-transporting ATPase subunit B